MRPTSGAARAAALLLCVGLSGCAAHQQEVDDPFRISSGDGDDVQLTVENHDFRDATIYAYWNGMRDRIGMVTGKTTKTFQMRWRSEDLQLRIDFVGGGGHRTETIGVWEGDHLHYVIRIRG